MGASQGDLSAEAVRSSVYIAGAPPKELPPPVVAKTKQHILDTVAAILSGSRLRLVAAIRKLENPGSVRELRLCCKRDGLAAGAPMMLR